MSRGGKANDVGEGITKKNQNPGKVGEDGIDQEVKGFVFHKEKGHFFPSLNKWEEGLHIWLQEDDGFYFLCVTGRKVICRWRENSPSLQIPFPTHELGYY